MRIKIIAAGGIILLNTMFSFAAMNPALLKKPSKKKSSAISVRKHHTVRYSQEIISYPLKWKEGSYHSKDLKLAVFYYKWNHHHSCDKNENIRWAKASIGKGVAPCWTPNPEYSKFIKTVTVSKETAKMYRLSYIPETENIDNCPDKAEVTLLFEKNKFCYTLTFLTPQKYYKSFIPDFALIMRNFSVLE